MSYHFRPTLVASAISLVLSTASYASQVREDVPYQYFRDFAENKGAFTIGARNVEIFDKQTNYIGTMLANVSMPDLRIVSRTNGIAVTVDPQYLNSVAHNRSYGTINFGNEATNPDEHAFDYLIVDRNNHPDYDYHVPRLNKLITEIAPVPVSSVPFEGENPKEGSYTDTERFSDFVRVGSGTQSSRSKTDEYTSIAGAYQYLTGGVPLTVNESREYRLFVEGDVFTSSHGPLATYGMAGDSGSALLGFDKTENQWVLVGVLATYRGLYGNGNSFVVVRPDFIEQTKNDDSLSLQNQGTNLTWIANGSSSTIHHSGNQKLVVPLKNTAIASTDSSRERPSLEHGKNVHFYGKNGTLTLNQNIDQGAGALYFHSNMTVKGTNSSQTWLGGGIDVDEGKTVTWQVQNPAGDRLSKIGAGTLYVNGQGKNQGSISVGDGTVVLAQRALNGAKQAFEQLGIVSGRPTVVLNDSNQIEPDNIYFGFRGGRLDLNGNTLQFSYIQNADDGARLVNHHASRTANININPIIKRASESDIKWLKWRESDPSAITIYEYINPHHNKRTDYFVLKEGGYATHFFPTNAKSNTSWEYLGSDKQAAINTVLARGNQETEEKTFSGYFGETDANRKNGALNVAYRPNNTNDLLMLNGGTALNGELRVEKGKLLLSGRPVAHARDMKKNEEVINDEEWVNREFKANTFKASQGGVLVSGRNVAKLEGNFLATDTARLHLGFIPRRTVSCVRSDYSGNTECNWQADATGAVFENLPTTQILGNITLQNQSSIVLGKSHLHGTAQGSAESNFRLSPYSQWTMNGNSRIGHLDFEAGSVLTLNEQYENATNTTTATKFNQLTLDGNLTGNGKIHYLTNVAASKGDHIQVNGTAAGNFVLFLKNTGKEPTAVNPLSLLNVKKGVPTNQTLDVALDGGYVDLGTYRYVLTNKNHDYRLYNPLKDAEQNVTTTQQVVVQSQQQSQKVSANIQALEKAYKDAVTKQNTLNTELKSSERTLAQLERRVTKSPYYGKKRAPIFYQQALKNLEKARQKHKQIESNITQQISNVTLARKALDEAKVALSKKNSVQTVVQTQTSPEQAKLLAQQKAQQLCEAQKLSTEICHKVAYNASAEDVMVMEAALLEAGEEVEKAEETLALAKTTLDEAMALRAKAQSESEIAEAENAITLAKQGVEQAQTALNEAELAESNALLAYEQDNAILTEAVNAVESASLSATNEKTTQESEESASIAETQSNIRQADAISRYANTALSELSASVNAGLQLGQNLNHQILSTKMAGVWANQQWQKTHHASDNYRAYNQQLALSQIGVSHALSPTTILGAVLSHSVATNDFAEGVSGKGKLTAFSLFVKKAWENGVFATIDGGLGKSRHQLNFNSQAVKFSRNFANAGMNLGINWDINGWGLQPSAGARYYRFSGVNYALDEAQVTHSAVNLVEANAGIKLDKVFELGAVSIRPSISSYYHDARSHKFNAKNSLNLNSVALNQAFGRYFNHEIGLTAQLSQWRLGGNVGVLRGDEIQNQKYATLNLHYEW